MTSITIDRWDDYICVFKDEQAELRFSDLMYDLITEDLPAEPPIRDERMALNHNSLLYADLRRLYDRIAAGTPVPGWFLAELPERYGEEGAEALGWITYKEKGGITI